MKREKMTEKEAVLQALDSWILYINAIGITLFVILILIGLYLLIAYIAFYNSDEYNWLGKALAISLSITFFQYVVYKISVIKLRALRIILKTR